MPDRRAIILLYVTVKLRMCLTESDYKIIRKDRVKRDARKLGFWMHGQWKYVKAIRRMNPNLFLPLESSGKLAWKFLARISDRRGCRHRPGCSPPACSGSPGRHWRSSSRQTRSASHKLCSGRLKIIQDYSDCPSFLEQKIPIYSFILSSKNRRFSFIHSFCAGLSNNASKCLIINFLWWLNGTLTAQ